DEQHAPAVRHDLAGLVQRLLEQGNRLGEIDDMDPVAHPEQVRLHLGVPTPGVVAEMDTRFQQLTHRELRHSHAVISYSGWASAGVVPSSTWSRWGHRSERRDVSPSTANPRAKWRVSRGLPRRMQVSMKSIS